MADSQGIFDSDLSYIRHSWGSVYAIEAPVGELREWRAIAKFGNHDVLYGDTSEDLLDKIRQHYPGRIKTNG